LSKSQLCGAVDGVDTRDQRDGLANKLTDLDLMRTSSTCDDLLGLVGPNCEDNADSPVTKLALEFPIIAPL
jgi:hypothetical protein